MHRKTMHAIAVVAAALATVMTGAGAAVAGGPVRGDASLIDVSVDTACGFPITFTAHVELTVLDFGTHLLVRRHVRLTASANGREASGTGTQNGPVEVEQGTFALTGTLHLTAPRWGVVLLTAGRVVYDFTVVPFRIVFEAGPHEYRQAGLPGDIEYARLCAYFSP